MAEQKQTPEPKAKKFAGTFETAEEMEKAFMRSQQLLNETIEREKRASAERDAATRTSEQLAGMLQQISDRSAPAPMPIVDDSGSFNEAAFDARIEARMKPVTEALTNLPNTISESLQALLQPLSAATAAKASFAANVEDFDEKKFQRFLGENPGVNARFQKLVGNPELAETAYDYAWTKYRDAHAAGTAPGSIDEDRKVAARRIAGRNAPEDTPSHESEIAQERIKKSALAAQNSIHADGQLAFFKEFFKGTSLEAKIAHMKESASEKGAD